MNNTFSMCWHNVIRHRKRFLASITGIAFGYAGLVLLGGYNDRWEHSLTASTGYLNHVGVVSVQKTASRIEAISHPKQYALSEEEQGKVERLANEVGGVEFVGRYLMGMGLASNGCETFPVMIRGVDERAQRTIWNHPLVQRWSADVAVLIKGQPFWESLSSNALGLTVGLARRLNRSHVESDFPRTSTQPTFRIPECSLSASKRGAEIDVQLFANTFDGYTGVHEGVVSQIYSTGIALADENGIMMSLSEASKLFATKSVTYMTVFLDNPNNAEKFAKDLDVRLRDSGLKSEVLTFKDERVNPFYTGIMGFLYVMEGVFKVLFLGIVILSIVSTINLSLRERRNELGVLRSLGYSRLHVAALVGGETTLFSLFGILIGFGVVQVVKWYLIQVNIQFKPCGFSGTQQFLSLPDVSTYCVNAVSLTGVAIVTATLVTARFLNKEVVHLLSK